MEAAFVLDPGPPHVLAVARLQLDDRGSQRYSFMLTGRPLRVAEVGEGAWRALLVAMADGRVLPGVRGLKGPLSCLSEPRYGIVWGAMGAARACFEAALE